MARTICRFFVGLWLLTAATLNAQTTYPPAAVDIILGQAAVPLYGPWKFTIGDSPTDPKTGKPLWAEPDFDDSHWETVDLTPKQGATNPIAGLSGFVPGWTARGHAVYSGFAWYRIRVRCQGQSSQPLALAGPMAVDDGYQVFMDGEPLGSFGDFTGTRPVVYPTQPVMFRLPQQGERLGGTRVLAFRFWMEPGTPTLTADAGGMHDAPWLGDSTVVTLHHQSQWLEIIRGVGSSALAASVFALLAVVAFSLMLFDRSDRVYAWIGFLFTIIAFENVFWISAGCTPWISSTPYLLTVEFNNSLIRALWVIVWWVWFGHPSFRWLPGVVGGLAALNLGSKILGEEIFGGAIPHQVALRFHTVGQVAQFLLFGLLAWVVALGIRRRGLEGWLALPVVLLRGVASFDVDLSVLHLSPTWSPFGILLNNVDLANLLIAAVIALLLLRRLLQSVKRQRQMAVDVKQAQEVQQVILPEQHIVLPGLEIESEYRPALEVGGDFFQIIPEDDDSLLIVAGDVAGKGLKAGMLVALLVGATRTAAQYTQDPAMILSDLNKRLLGRSDARATCLAIRIARDGSAVLANAGHLPPYLNGAPVEIAGSLPLGILPDLDCSVLVFRLSPADRLVLVSDGVPEAMDEHGKLFGFDAVLELVRNQPSAARIAETAQSFGQEDDISVIAITRVPVAVPAAQPALA
jgi:hypothetical protein